MLNLARNIVLGVAGAGAAGAGIYSVTSSPHTSEEGAVRADLVAEAPDGDVRNDSVCLKRDLPFIAGDQSGCHKRSDFAEWRKTALVDPSRGALSMTMSSPRDATMPAKDVTTCREFSERRYDGWYAMTSRDMRREAFFVRACGVIELLSNAREAKVSYFTDDTMSTGDVASISAAQILRLGSDPATDPADPEIEQTGDSAWRLSIGGQTSYFTEIAGLDFDGDETLEILAFFSAGPDEATARISELVLIERDAANAQIEVKTLDFRQPGVTGG